MIFFGGNETFCRPNLIGAVEVYSSCQNEDRANVAEYIIFHKGKWKNISIAKITTTVSTFIAISNFSKSNEGVPGMAHQYSENN